jgi:TolB-like protein/DNA-binding SARP family transcriptional activator/Tfp pilus assembly protein PilF
MKRLKLLGGASIDSGDATGGPVTGRAVQRRRIALLALLSVRSRGGLSRDKLIAFLWPDSDSDRGRHLLSDSIYRINQELGSDTIQAAGDDLRLDCDAVGCDVHEFEVAIEERDYQRAATLYQGPFMDGFFLSECVELERWIEQERDRLGRSYQAALEALAADATTKGNHERAVEWWRRIATLDPYSSRVALQLMRSLAAAGNRPGALQHAQIHSALVRSDFGTEPDKTITDYVVQLKRGDAVPDAGTTKVKAAAPAAAEITKSDVTERSAPPVAAARTSEALSITRPRWAWIVVGVVAVAATIITVALRQTTSPNEATLALAADSTPSIAVLPFVNLSAEQNSDYFSDGITDEVTAALDRIEGLKVAARTSAFAFKGQGVDIREIAQRLRVRSIVEGSVRKDGQRVRISARLIDAVTGYRLWSDEYEREMSGVLAVQSDIARSIAAALKQQIDPNEPNERLAQDISRDPEAYELFLKGRYAWHRRTEQSLKEARDHFEAAVQRVPSYARAWAGLGDAYAVAAFYDYVPPREGYPKAEDAARRALALDSTLAGPHATLGYVSLYYHWNWPVAEQEFQRAIRLAPEYSTAHQWYGNFLTAMGRFDEAKTAFERATEAEPLSLIAAAASGWSRFYARDFAAAEQHFAHTLDLEPNYELAYLWRGQTFDAQGKYNEALAALTRAVELSQRSSLTLAALAHALARAGQRDSARRVVIEVEGRSPARYVPSYEIAKVHLALGDTTRALDLLERALHERSHSLVFLKVDPFLHGLKEPRYAALLERVGLR